MLISTLKWPELATMAPSFILSKWRRSTTLMSPVEVTNTSPSGAASTIGMTRKPSTTATLELTESNTFLDKVDNGKADLFLLGWGADYEHRDIFFTPHFCSDSNQIFGPQDSALYTRLADAREESDFNTQVGMYEEASDLRCSAPTTRSICRW